MPESEAVLQVTELAKSYKGHQVVKNVSLSIKSGQVVGLLGPNGAGKTTCFYMIIGSIREDHGQILFNDQNIEKLPMHLRAKKKGLDIYPRRHPYFENLMCNKIYWQSLRPDPSYQKHSA